MWFVLRKYFLNGRLTGLCSGTAKHMYALIDDDWMLHTAYLRRNTDCVLDAEQHFGYTVSAEKITATTKQKDITVFNVSWSVHLHIF
jgi:ketosteroid isomerase-like protein